MHSITDGSSGTYFFLEGMSEGLLLNYYKQLLMIFLSSKPIYLLRVKSVKNNGGIRQCRHNC